MTYVTMEYTDNANCRLANIASASHAQITTNTVHKITYDKVNIGRITALTQWLSKRLSLIVDPDSIPAKTYMNQLQHHQEYPAKYNCNVYLGGCHDVTQ